MVAQETAQKDVDEYLSNIDPKGKTVEELEELYETTNKDLEDFSQYKDNLDLDLSKFDTILADIRKEQPFVHTLHLVPRITVLGIGCRRARMRRT